MAPTIRDWQYHGVDLKVELATSGSLVVGGTQTDFPFTTGGEYGAPAGWDAGEYYGGNAGNESAYNWTTTNSPSVFSVSPKAASARQAGIWLIQSFAVVPGYRYQIGAQARQMAGKDGSIRSVTMERSTNGTTWTYYTGVSGFDSAQTEWEQVLATGNAMPAGYTYGRIYLMGGPATGATNLWGTQFQNLFVKQLDLAPEPIVWTDITCDVMGLAIRYGRERFTNRYDVASMQVDLLNTDGIYSFHKPHPLGLQPGRQVRVTATYKGVTYPMAFHVLDSIVDAYDMGGQVVSRWSCTDPTSILANANVKTNQAIYPDGGAQRVGLLLDQVGYVPRLLDANKWDMQAITASGRTIRDEAGLTADSEGGQFFADRLGNCVYKNRDWNATDPNINQVTADLLAYPAGDAVPVVDQVPTKAGAPMIAVRELVTDWSLSRLINFVSLANAGGTAHEYVDQASFKTYGPATYQRHDFVLWTDQYLPTRAADIMTGYTEPTLRVNSVSFAPGQSVKPDQVTPQVDGWMNLGYTVVTPDISTDTLDPAGTYRLTMDAQFETWNATGFPFLVSKVGGTQREYSFYGYVPSNNGLYFSGRNPADTTYTSAIIETPMRYGTRHSWGYEWTHGSNVGAKVIDGVRTPLNLSTVAGTFNTTGAITIGTVLAGTTGKIYGARLERIVGGAVSETIWKFDPNEYPGTGTSYTDPRGRTWTLSAPGAITSRVPGTNIPGPPAWEWTLGVFLNWLVRVWYTHPVNFWGYAFCVHIQSLEHRITPTDWETTMAVDLPVSFVELEWLDIEGWDQSTWDEDLWDQGDEVAGSQWNTGANWSDPNSKWGT